MIQQPMRDPMTAMRTETTVIRATRWRRRLAWACAALLLAFGAVDAYAQRDLPPERPTDSELVLLPKACEARLKGNDEVRRAWQQQIGRENFLHLHHLCFGLNYNNRARLTFDKKRKLYFLQRAVANFDYVLRHWPADSALRPEAEAGKREAEMMLQML
ncbi:MAG: hypothetical protein KJZ81_09210 [Burkholderiaceae bacterium]|nr:hypothetical protein [Burkholderiaceae bacterium]